MGQPDLIGVAAHGHDLDWLFMALEAHEDVVVSEVIVDGGDDVAVTFVFERLPEDLL